MIYSFKMAGLTDDDIDKCLEGLDYTSFTNDNELSKIECNVSFQSEQNDVIEHNGTSDNNDVPLAQY